jgi:hypothetical protein
LHFILDISSGQSAEPCSYMRGGTAPQKVAPLPDGDESLIRLLSHARLQHRAGNKKSRETGKDVGIQPAPHAVDKFIGYIGGTYVIGVIGGRTVALHDSSH